MDGGDSEVPGLTSLQESLSPPPSGHSALGSHEGRLGQSSEEEEVNGEENCGDEMIPGHHQHPQPLLTNRGVCKQDRESQSGREDPQVSSLLPCMIWAPCMLIFNSSPVSDAAAGDCDGYITGATHYQEQGEWWWVDRTLHRISYFR